MSLSPQNQNSGEPNPAPAPLTFTLEPLRAFGPEPPYALDVPGIDTVLPSEVLLRWENDEYDTELLTSTTLFVHPFDEIPAGARLIKASFAVATAKDHEPKSVTITPPTLLETDSPQLLEPFLAWATKRGLATVQAAHLAIAILIAVLDPALPELADDDDDDDPHHHHHHQHTHCVAPHSRFGLN